MSGKAADTHRGKVKRATLAEVANAVGLAKTTVSRRIGFGALQGLADRTSGESD